LAQIIDCLLKACFCSCSNRWLVEAFVETTEAMVYVLSFNLIMDYENVVVEIDGAIAVVTLNRPQQLNSLSYDLVKDLSSAMQTLDQDEAIRVIIVTGGEKVFAAGADIKEMAELGPFDERVQGRLAYRDKINQISKPVIAAVSGFALGGGCELAMSCDIIVASETARFGQPEVNRLTHLIGKHRAMELVLTAEIIGAVEAERLGLVNRVVPVELMLEEAKNIAKKIAVKPKLAIQAAKEAVLKAANTALDEGLDFERKSFYMLLASEDRKEGMKAFLEKRKAEYKGR
jgi:enoyl-CoA hydratase